MRQLVPMLGLEQSLASGCRSRAGAKGVRLKAWKLVAEVDRQDCLTWDHGKVARWAEEPVAVVGSRRVEDTASEGAGQTEVEHWVVEKK